MRETSILFIKLKRRMPEVWAHVKYLNRKCALHIIGGIDHSIESVFSAPTFIPEQQI
jgi:hypothetical protein